MKLSRSLNTPLIVGAGLSLLFLLSRFGKKINPNQTKTMKSIFESTFFGKYDSLKPLIFAQAVHETGNFTSRAFKEQNNMFGMKVPSRRPFLGKKDPKSMYASYTTVKKSLEDYLVYLNFVNFPTNKMNPETFSNELKRRSYFEDNVSNYIRGLNNGLKIWQQ